METMTARERLRALSEGSKPDRVPVFGFFDGYAAKLYGISLKEFYTDIDKCVRAQLLAFELHGTDDSPGYGWADWGGWEFGGSIQFPETYAESAPKTVSSPVTTVSDVDKLGIPDPRVAGMFPLLLKFNHVVRPLGFPARVFAGSVTSMANGIIGKERILRWYLKEPAAVHAVYEKATSFLIRAADMMIAEFGSENTLARISAPLDSNDLISPKIFETFSLPYLKRLIQGLKERGITQFVAHICGNQVRNLDAWAEVPLPPRAVISVGAEMDIARVAEAFKHQHIIAGNVPTALLNLGTYDEVFEAARQIVCRYKDLPGGFILMPACDTPITSPPLNIHAMVKAAKEFGRYS